MVFPAELAVLVPFDTGVGSNVLRGDFGVSFFRLSGDDELADADVVVVVVAAAAGWELEPEAPNRRTRRAFGVAVVVAGVAVVTDSARLSLDFWGNP